MQHSESTSFWPKGLTQITSKDTLLASILAHFEQKLRSLASQQDELMNMRENLLIQREDGLADKKAVREQRVRTVNAEVTLMNAFRKHYKQLDRPLPNSLIDAYEAAERQGQELRSCEESLLEAEEDLGASEWTFADLETEFYQYKITELISDDMSTAGIEALMKGRSTKPNQDPDFQSSIQAQYQTIEFEYAQVSKRFEALRKQQALRMDTFTQSGDVSLVLAENAQMKYEAEALSDDLLGMIANCDIRLQQLRPDLQLGPSAPFTRLHLVSEPNEDRRHHLDEMKAAYTSRSEGALPSTVNDVPVDERMADWSLQSLKMSALEKLRYLNILRSKLEGQRPMVVDFDLLEPLITNSWRTDDVDHWTRHLSSVLINPPHIKGSTDADTDETKPCWEKGSPFDYLVPQSAEMIVFDDDNVQHQERLELPLDSYASTHAPGKTTPTIERACQSSWEGSITPKAQDIESRNIYSGCGFRKVFFIDSVPLHQDSCVSMRHTMIYEPLQKSTLALIAPTVEQNGTAKLDIRISLGKLNDNKAVMMRRLRTMEFLLVGDSFGVTNALGLSKGISYAQATDSDGRYTLQAFLEVSFDMLYA